MRLLLIAFFLSANLFSFGQAKVDFSASLNYSNSNEGLDTIFRSNTFRPEGKSNYHFAFHYSSPLQKNIWLKIGIGFTSTGYQINLEERFVLASQINTSGVIVGGGNPVVLTEKFIIKYDYHFLEIPIALHYEVSKGKISPFVEAGFSSLYYLQSHIKENEFGKISKETYKEKKFSRIQVAPTFSFGMSYQFREKWELLVQPNFRYHLTKTIDGLMKEHLWSAGLALGARLTLR